MIRFDGLAKDLSGTNKVLLAYELRKRSRPHPVGKRPALPERRLSLLLKKVLLPFQYFSDSGLTALERVGVGLSPQLTLTA